MRRERSSRRCERRPAHPAVASVAHSLTQQPRIGVAYRRQVAAQIFDLRSEIDCLEILVEHFLPLTTERRRELEQLRQEFVLIPHGVALSPGSVERAPDDYYERVGELVALIEAPFFGEHASISRGGGYDLRHLSPVWRTQASLDRLVENLELAMDRLGVPIALETIAETHQLPGAEIPWDEFAVQAAQRSGGELLVDVTNVWVNRANRIVVNQPDLYGKLGQASWRQFHLAGIAREADGFYVDSHDHALTEPVLDAYRDAIRIQAAPFAIVERDARLEAFDELAGDLQALRRVHEQELIPGRA